MREHGWINGGRVRERRWGTAGWIGEWGEGEKWEQGWMDGGVG